MARRRGQFAGPGRACPVVPVLAPMLARAADGPDFRPSRNGRGRVAAAAHGLRERGRAMAGRRGQFAGPWVSGHAGACTHVGAGGGRARFSNIEKRTREGRGCRARAARAWESDGRAARAGCRPRVIRSLRLWHASWRKVVGATDLRTSGAICHRSSHGRGRLQQARRMVVAKALL